jgi:hypothetical protein
MSILQVESSPFVNRMGILITVSLLLNTVMVFRLVAGGRNNSSCLKYRSNGRRMRSDWYALMMQLKPGDVGAAKEDWNFCFLQANDGLGVEIINIQQIEVNPMTYLS